MMKGGFVLAALILLLPCIGAAQPDTDSLAPGIIVVRRKPMKAMAELRISYSFDRKKVKRRKWQSRTRRFRNEYAAWITDPSRPQPLLDSTGSKTELKTQEGLYAKIKVPDPVDLNRYVNDRLDYSFRLTDSAKMDSLRLTLLISREGVPQLLTGTPAGRTAAAGQALAALSGLNRWYPAMAVERNGKVEPVPCRMEILVIIFARPEKSAE